MSAAKKGDPRTVTRLTHGQTSSVGGRTRVSPTYKSWRAMKDRCLNPRAPNYARYGGRGITIFDDWLDFPAFMHDMGERPAGRTLGRIDNDGPYSPNNCRWETAHQQQTNRKKPDMHPNSLKNLDGRRPGTTEMANKAWGTRRARYGPTGLRGH